MSIGPKQSWWTAAEIAEAGLIDMPATKQGVNAYAARIGWKADRERARRRDGKGGGWEYHWTLFPSRTQAQLIAARPPLAEGVTETTMPRDEVWTWFEGLKEGAKLRAKERLDTIQSMELLHVGGLTMDMAARQAARMHGCSATSIWNWRRMIEGVRVDDRLPYLAPRNSLSARKGPIEVPDETFMDLIRSDWLRPSAPTLTSCYDRAVRVFEAMGKGAPPKIHNVRRELKRSVSKQTEILARKGIDALKAKYPPQVRDKSSMHALEAVNGDYHRFDVFVRFPAEGGAPEEIIRPQMVAFQDVYSGKILSWRVARSANSRAVQLCLGDMIEDWGIPEHVLLDNGREFAAKSITGGTPNRYRFKVREDDIPGLLTTLGCEIHWATPYSGQSKPIERAFRDMCDRIAKHPAFEGAYTGNRPDAKPENYGARAIALDDFLAVLTEEITAHNTRQGRRSEVAYGRSFAEVFAESYESAPIRRATEAQRRLWLMGAEGVRVNSNTGAIAFMKNTYWADWLLPHAGDKVVARFDEAKLWDGLHVYALSGAYLGHVPCQQKVGFFDVDEGRNHAKARRGWLNAEKAALEAQRKLNAAEIATGLEAAPVTPDAPLDAKVVKLLAEPVEHPKPETKRDPAFEAARAAVVADLNSEREARDGERGEEDDKARFLRARALEATLAGGGAITRDQEQWLSGFQRTPIYKALEMIEADFGVLADPTKT